VDSDIAGKRVGKCNPLQFSCHWPGDDKSILLIVTSLVNTTIVSILNTTISGLPDPSQTILELWGYWLDPIRDGSLQAINVPSIIDNNTAASWVKAVIKLNNPTCFFVIYRSQQANGTSGAQMPIDGGLRYLTLDDTSHPPAKDKINNIGEESDDDVTKQCTN
jgi:hypothetical protein